MVRERFNESFERLREQSNKLADTDRSTDNFDEIVDERVKLDQLRDEVTTARKDVVSRYEAPAPDVVAPARGRQDTRRIGKVGAVVAGVLIVVAVIVGALLMRTLRDGFPLRLDETVETIQSPETGERCRWRVQATLRNESQETVTITYLSTVLDRQRLRARDTTLPTIAPGETAVASGTWMLSETAGCPEPDDVDHTNLVIGFSDVLPDASSPNIQTQERRVSRGF